MTYEAFAAKAKGKIVEMYVERQEHDPAAPNMISNRPEWTKGKDVCFEDGTYFRIVNVTIEPEKD